MADRIVELPPPAAAIIAAPAVLQSPAAIDALPASSGRPLPMTLMQSIAMRFGVVLLNALTGVVTARALEPAGRGELAALVLWPVLLAGLTTFGLPSALIYHMRRTPERTGALVGAALTLAILTGILGTVVGLVVLPHWLRQHPPEIVVAAQYCLLATVVSALTFIGRAAWEAIGRFDLSNRSQVIGPLLILAGLISQTWHGNLTPVSAGVTYVLAGPPLLLWILVSLGRSCRPTWHGAVDACRRLVPFGLRSYGADLCGTLAIYVDQALVVGLLAPAAMGLYVVGLSLSRVISPVHTSVAMLVFPRSVGLQPADLAAAIGRSARLGALVMGGLGVGVATAGPMLVRVVYGGAYGPAGDLLPLLVGQVVLAGMVQVLLQGFMATGRPDVATMVQLSGLLVGLPFFLVLVPMFGAMGAAAALLAATASRLVLAVMAYRVSLGVTPRLWIGWADVADLIEYRGAALTLLGRLWPGGRR